MWEPLSPKKDSSKFPKMFSETLIWFFRLYVNISCFLRETVYIINLIWFRFSKDKINLTISKLQSKVNFFVFCFLFVYLTNTKTCLLLKLFIGIFLNFMCENVIEYNFVTVVYQHGSVSKLNDFSDTGNSLFLRAL